MRINAKGLNLVKEFEGCYLKAYKCPAGVWTIGYGHTGGVYSGMEINHAQAVVLLQKDLESFEQIVESVVKVPINENQFSALVSFAFNCGGNALRTSDLLKYLNQGKYIEAAKEFLKWNKATDPNTGKKVVLNGLTRRRQAEKNLFLEAVNDIDNELSQAVSKIIRSGVHIEFNKWKRMDLMNLKEVPALLYKLGGIKVLYGYGVITNYEKWDKGRYTQKDVRSLLIKYAKGVQS